MTLTLFALKLGRERGTVTEEKAKEVLKGMREMPEQIAYVTEVLGICWFRVRVGDACWYEYRCLAVVVCCF